MKRIASSLVFAAAAFASIATSAPATWFLEDSAEIPTTEVPTGGQAFSITAEARGGDYASGEVEVSLELSGDPVNLQNPVITVALISEADPAQRAELTVVVDASVRQPLNFGLPAFDSCDADPCFEDFRLEVRNATANTSVTLISSNARVTLEGLDNSIDADDAVSILVLPLGELE